VGDHALLLVVVSLGFLTMRAWSQETNHFLNFLPSDGTVTTDTFALEYKLLDAPEAPNVFLDGSGTSTKEVIGQNFTQNMTYTLEVSFRFKASNAKIVDDVIHYDLANTGGRIHFFGQAIDVFMGQTTTLNFDHTYEYLEGTGSGTLTYSTTLEQVETIDFRLPLSIPDKFRPSRFGFHALSNLLRVDILNFSFWKFDEDYWISASSDRCASSEPCAKPKALLVAGHGNLPYADELFAAAAADLWERGWLPLIPPAPTLEDVQTMLNNDPCIRGLYIHAHGDPNGSVILGKQGDPMGHWKVLPADLAATIPGAQLDFVTVLYCFLEKSEWQAAFPQSRIIISHKLFLGKYAFAPYDKLMQSLFDHGTPLHACDQFGLSLSKNFSNISKSQDECASFGICDSGDCGSNLFPVTACVDSVGMPTAGAFSVAPMDSMFSIRLQLPVTYSDSVGCVASYFTNIPQELVHPTLLPLGRFLVFADVEKDSSVVPDSLTVEMKYLDSDLAHAGIADETKLVAYWTSADSVELQPVAVHLDTVVNCLTLNVPRWGLVGIYASDDVTGIKEPDLMTKVYQLYQNYPNPFNPATTIRFQVPKPSEVKIIIYNILGREVRTLVDRELEAGKYSEIWNGKNNNNISVASGVYFVRMQANDFVKVNKLLLIK